MKKILLLATFFIVGITQSSQAQLQEGDLLLGTDIVNCIATSSTNGLFGLI